MHRHRPACQTAGISRANDTNKILVRIDPRAPPPAWRRRFIVLRQASPTPTRRTTRAPMARVVAKGGGVAATRARRAGRRSGRIPLRHESETAHADAGDAQLSRRKSTITSDLATAAASKNCYRRRTDKTLPGNESPAATAPKKSPTPYRPSADSFHPQRPAAGSRFRFHSPPAVRGRPGADATRTPREVKQIIGQF
ncbi:hypothetical protein EVAR_37349_1 [Eumeta japonica]|uniref:Uncharacterized protein n=1 Tax=Eumeta variegata TaxID=151549 RepID=A0A4C1X1P6_EUMVA|nr:hypothetical protein EVAR_37349_1 [Eumeta japonica]